MEVREVNDPTIEESTDAIIKITASVYVVLIYIFIIKAIYLWILALLLDMSQWEL